MVSPILGSHWLGIFNIEDCQETGETSRHRFSWTRVGSFETLTARRVGCGCMATARASFRTRLKIKHEIIN
jgi:hypothetical protein